MFYLKFATKEEAVAVLSPRFFGLDEDSNKILWDGSSTPITKGNETLVHVPNETIQRAKWNADSNRTTLEDGTPDLSPYTVTGFHCDVALNDEGTEYDAYKITTPNNPAHTFG